MFKKILAVVAVVLWPLTFGYVNYLLFRRSFRSIGDWVAILFIHFIGLAMIFFNYAMYPLKGYIILALANLVLGFALYMIAVTILTSEKEKYQDSEAT